MEIAHITKPHPETGLVNSKLGVWLFLASEVMLFGALFSSYIIMRIGSMSWPHGYTLLNVPLATVNTFALISSSVTIVLAWASLKLNDFGKFRMYMTGTIALSFVFLVIKYFEYTAKFEHGLYPSTNTFLAIYFTMTGLHALHMIIGVGLMCVITWMAWKGKFSSEWYTPVEMSGLYWHFVDIVWIFLFPLLYLIDRS